MDKTYDQAGHYGDRGMLLKCEYVHFNRHYISSNKGIPHRHSCVEIIYAGQGGGMMHEGSRSFRYLPNQVVVYQPGPLHWSEDDKDSQNYHLCLGVTGEGSSKLPAGLYNAGNRLLPLFKMVEDASDNLDDSPFQKSRLDMLASLIFIALLESLDEEAAASKDSCSRKARTIIETRFMEPLTLDSLALDVHTSSDRLRHLFKKDYGVSLIQYLLQRRMDHAATLLKNTDMKITGIASACGFPDPYYFSRMFRKTLGNSPKEYRDKHLALHPWPSSE